MVEGLEVTIRYRGAKYDQVASPATASSEFAILKKDLAHLRVHSPSQKNVRRVKGSFILHWPSAGTNTKLVGHVDSLHTRWFKLCSDDPEALKLREFLSIESITMVQDGIVIRSTARQEQASRNAPPGTLAERLGEPLPEIVQQPVPALVSKMAPPIIPPPRVVPNAPRSDREPPPHLKRRMSSEEGPSNVTRQKLDAPEAPRTSPHPLTDVHTHPEPTQPPTSLEIDPPGDPSTLVDTTHAVPEPARDEPAVTLTTRVARALTPPPPPRTTPPLPAREPGEMTPQPISTPVAGPSPGPPGTRPHPPIQSPCHASPRPGSSSSGNGDHLRGRRDHDVNRLLRELWDTRRQLTAMQAREQVLLDNLEKLGARPEGAGADRNGVSREELTRLEAELRAERARRVRAERTLSDVERECRAPFVVPALFQAFLGMSELSD